MINGTDQPVMQAVTTRGKVVNIVGTQAERQPLARRSVIDRVLLNADAARSSHATLMFRGLLFVALIVAALVAFR